VLLKGLLVKPVKRFFDERGFFAELMRFDWQDFFGEDTIVQVNHSVTYPGVVRAWHRHLRGQVDYFLCLKGAVKICVYDEESGELDEVVSSGQDLQVVRVPGQYWHGFKALGDEPAMIVYFTTKLYDRVDPDEDRRAWDDVLVVPACVNGKKNDPRAGKPWDWNLLPNM